MTTDNSRDVQEPTNLPRIQRDLLWSVNSASLLNDAPEACPLQRNDLDLQHVSEAAEKPSDHRVGRYFERLIRYWLTELRGVTDLQHSTQIRDGNRTIGELDFLFTDEQGQRTHLETAVKFYLYDSQSEMHGSHFIGPNAGDTFERKTKRLFDHQLPLGRKHFGDVRVTQAWVKGRIFYHPEQVLPDELPAALSPQHQRGTWIRASELEYLCNTLDQTAYRVLQKPHWLSQEIADVGDPTLMPPEQMASSLKEHFQTSSYPVLVSKMTNSVQRFAETDRIFIVADAWPSRDDRLQRDTA